MRSCVFVFTVLAMARNHGTMSFVFGPLAIFTAPQDSSSPTSSASTLQWPVDVDANAVAATTPFSRRRPTANRRRPSPGSSNIVFPSSDDFPPFAESKNPLQNPQGSKDYGVLTQNRGADNNEQRFSPESTPRPLRPKQASQGSDGAIVFEGPSTARRTGGRRRVRPTGRPPVNAPADLTSNVEAPDSASDSASPPPPCPCPTTSEFNPVCAEVQGERATMLNLSMFKCAQICVGSTDVKLLFHGTCQKTINKLNPIIHD